MARLTCLAVDMGTKRLGWAVGGGNVVAHDEIALPGMTHLGALFGAVRNALCDLFDAYQPARLVWCAAEFVEHETVWEAHKATRAIAELAAHDNTITAEVADQRRARIAVLGRGDFGEAHPSGLGLVASGGRRQAKEAVAAWCREQGYGAAGFETGNALVLRRYCEILGRGKQHHERIHRGVVARPPGEAASRASAGGSARQQI